ncbi:MAG TPA: hypothetical protein VGS41_10725 [Chthonomonadales bacterium]|nr:hypothetical protein [Chthonomonadales bacterium]
MNEPEKERILKLVAEGSLRPAAAAELIASLSEEAPKPAGDQAPSSKTKAQKAPSKPIEVEMERPDGTHYTLQVPQNLLPMFFQFARVTIREAARRKAQESWSTIKCTVKRRTEEVKSSVHSKVRRRGAAENGQPDDDRSDTSIEGRRQILQMVQNGRITAEDAARLIRQIDALAQHAAA